MKPTIEDFLDCAARWRGRHRGIAYELSWHGRSDYSPEGTWCWYIWVNDEQFYPDDWRQLRLNRQDREFAESWHRYWCYDDFPNLDAHGGWTFGEMNVYLGRDGKEHEQVKVGCDYAHLWDREGDFREGRKHVEHDVKRSIDLLCEKFPNRRPACHYCGKYGEPDEFYIDGFGELVHTSHLEKLRADGWSKWLPATEQEKAV